MLSIVTSLQSRQSKSKSFKKQKSFWLWTNQPPYQSIHQVDFVTIQSFLYWLLNIDTNPFTVSFEFKTWMNNKIDVLVSLTWHCLSCSSFGSLDFWSVVTC
jgi:hypothetical protein